MVNPAASVATTASGDPGVCPYLGLADDPRTRFAFATTAHRCYSPSDPGRIEVSQQAALCLGPDYRACRRYAASVAAGGPVLVATGAKVPIAQVSGRVRWREPDGRRGLMIRAAAILVPAIILAAVLVALAGLPSAAPLASTSSARHPSAGNVIASPGSPLNSPLPSPATASVAPPSEPTPSPTGSVRALPATHIVTRGETLTSIARHYGVTLAALEKANHIKDPSLIVVGQRLIIPAP